MDPLSRDVGAPGGDLARETLISAVLEFLEGQDLLTLAEIRGALEREIDAAGAGALLALKACLAIDTGWGYYPPDPLATRIHHLLADRLLREDSELLGSDCVAAVRDEPVAIFANHLSYADANLVEILLHRAGAAAMAARLTAVAGPKVFTSRQRRFSSLCFGTIKVPQSADVSSEEAVLSARDVARAARQAIEVAHGRLSKGDALLLFAEGTRSRSGTMQPMLPAVARYLEAPGTWILPAGLVGSEALFPVGVDGLRPARIVLRFGRPFLASGLIARAGGHRRLLMDAVGLAVAELLPSGYGGVYRDAAVYGAAGQALADARGG